MEDRQEVPIIILSLRPGRSCNHQQAKLGILFGENSQEGKMEKLFSTARIQGIELKNRLVALPLFTGYALPDARLSPLMLDHYRRLGESGAAVVVIPNVAVSANGITSERGLLLDHDKHIAGLNRLARVIKENGSIACIQLNHAGRYAVTDNPFLPSAMNTGEITTRISTLKNFMKSFPFVKRFGLTAHVAKMTAGWTQQMSDGEIEQIIGLFGDAAVRAYQAGFDMIELHGATGYLITQFLSAATNRRQPPWGGTLETRFTSRHGYRTLSVLSSRADMKIGMHQFMQRVPKNKDIFDRQLFINVGQEDGFDQAAREYAAWSDQYVRTHLGRSSWETIFVDEFQDPVEVVMDHLKDNFGVLSLVYEENSKWKNDLVLNAPADIVVFRSGIHPNLMKILVPCDLFVFTLMQIRAALHAFHGRSGKAMEKYHSPIERRKRADADYRQRKKRQEGRYHEPPSYKNDWPYMNKREFPLTGADLAPYIYKGTAAGIGITAGVYTGSKEIGAGTFWVIDSIISYWGDGPITDPKFGIEFINPPNADGSSIDNNNCP